MTEKADSGAPQEITPQILKPLESLFPALSTGQVRRIEVHGRRRSVADSEILLHPGSRAIPFFVVSSGQIEIVVPSLAAENVVAVLEAGQFTGEMTLLAGRPAIVKIRASGEGTVIELTRDQLMSLIQTESDLGEIIMRAYLLRRTALITQGLSDVILIGSRHNADTLRVQEFLTRNGHPFSYVDLDRDSDVQQLLDHFLVSDKDIPVIICRTEIVLRNPSEEQIAACLGFNIAIDPAPIRDLVVIGAGPAGLAAAVYGASEGLDVLVLEAHAPGGQAGSSSRIENYLGFPTGVSGQELTGRAYSQAQKFGAQIVVAKGAIHLSCGRKPYSIIMSGDERISTRAVVVATGAEYRQPPIANASSFYGAGIYFEATHVEAQLCPDEEVIVVGGGNAAGQAAVFLAQTAARVHVFIRSTGLAQSMSRYLVRRIEEHPTIDLQTGAELVELEGENHLERVVWRDNRTGLTNPLPVRHVFFMAGAVPSTGWLGGCVALDEKGFVKTGADLAHEDLETFRWPLSRAPHLLETSLPGVFAVGDVRSGSIKRVASAVGEGSISIAYVHRALTE